MTLVLTDSVGQSGNNVETDVSAVQKRLVDLGYDWVVVDGKIGSQTIDTIKLFQAIINGHQRVGGSGVDGRIDVNGNTHKWLDASNAPRWQLMPAGSAADGYVNIEVQDPNDDHDYGANWFATIIRDASAHYRDNHLSAHADDALLTVNDVSKPRGGDTSDHAGHETGMSGDLRLPRKDGTAPGNTTFKSPEYDQDAMRSMLQALQAQTSVTKVLFNDPVLIGEGLCVAHAGHDNHVHLEIEPPQRS